MKQVIIIRKDLKMRRGKEIAQGSHASIAFLVTKDITTVMHELYSGDIKKWVESGQTKICLQVNSEKELVDLHLKAKDSGLRSHLITDAGRTEFDGRPTKTAVAIGPNESEDIDKITKHLKLY